MGPELGLLFPPKIKVEEFKGLPVPIDYANIQECCSHVGSLNCLPQPIVSLRQGFPQEAWRFSTTCQPIAGGVQTIANPQ